MKPNLILLLTCLLAATGVFAQGWSQSQRLDPFDPSPMSNYGVSVDVSGNFAVIGANQNSFDETGGAFQSTAGAAYIRQRQASGNWITIDKLVASDRSSNDLFGSSVSIAGVWALVGAGNKDLDTLGPTDLKEAGAVYTFTITGPGSWGQTQKLVSFEPDDYDRFGHSISSGGDFLAVGAPGEDLDATGANSMSNAGAVYIFEKDNTNTWNYLQKLDAPDRSIDDGFGMVVHTDGHTIVVGVPLEDEDSGGGATMADAGAVYVFQKNPSGTFDFVQKIVSPDRAVGDGFGSAVAVETDFLVVGAPYHDFDETGAALMADAGAIYFFDRSPGSWGSPQKFTPSDRDAGDNFGFSVGVSDFNAIASSPFDVVFTPGSAGEQSGAAFVFDRVLPAGWSMAEKVFSVDNSDDDFFGGAVSMDRDFIIIGAQDKTIDTSGAPITAAGTSFLFELCSAPMQDTLSICEGDSVFLGGAWQTGAGVYIDNYSSGYGCDTIVETTLEVADVDEGITVNSTQLVANNDTAVSYQWIDCTAGADIPGETGSTFTPSVSGEYAVRINDGTCTRESDCESFFVLGLDPPASLGWSVFPNPFTDYIVLENLGAAAGAVQVQLTDLSGRLVYTATLNRTQNIIQLDQLSSGVYFLQLMTADGRRAVEKLVK